MALPFSFVCGLLMPYPENDKFCHIETPISRAGVFPLFHTDILLEIEDYYCFATENDGLTLFCREFNDDIFYFRSIRKNKKYCKKYWDELSSDEKKKYILRAKINIINYEMTHIVNKKYDEG